MGSEFWGAASCTGETEAWAWSYSDPPPQSGQERLCVVWIYGTKVGGWRPRLSRKCCEGQRPAGVGREGHGSCPIPHTAVSPQKGSDSHVAMCQDPALRTQTFQKLPWDVHPVIPVHASDCAGPSLTAVLSPELSRGGPGWHVPPRNQVGGMGAGGAPRAWWTMCRLLSPSLGTASAILQGLPLASFRLPVTEDMVPGTGGGTQALGELLGACEAALLSCLVEGMEVQPGCLLAVGMAWVTAA